MFEYGIELTSSDPALLSFLSHYPDNPSWMVKEVQGSYYLLSPNFDGLTTPGEVWQEADALLFTLNGILKLKFRDADLTRGSKVAHFDKAGQIANTTASRSIGVRVRISAGETYYQENEAKSMSSITIWDKAQKDDAVKEALEHYSNPHNWFNLYKTYEVIKKDTNRRGESGMVERGVFLKWAKGRNESFEWAANKFRHSSLGYHSKSGVVLMTLQEATEFVSDLLFQWLQTK